jgi:hypothetical protein
MSGTTVTLDSHGIVDEFFPAPPGVYGEHCTDAEHYMAVNICSLSRDTWSEVRRRLDVHVAAGETGTFYETVFAEMTAQGAMTARAVIFPTDRWYEIDAAADLRAAELIFRGLPSVAGGPSLRALHPDVPQ